jgi:predicted Ser/Thr protein kinase
MALTPGTRFGPYEITAPLGAGGMGEVYRARDTRLGRDVALKILPPDMARDPSRRQRFEIEARAVAALNHPNIVAVYDVGEGYIVSELVEGESLRSVKLGQRKAIDAAVQIAEGLAAAHAAGITHRDLKPENILLTRDGRVKILDFGLARMAEPQSTAADPAATETMAMRTEPGAVMGTVGYMSPEQVRGMPADHRSDVFSFGLVLYELLAGKRAFARDSSIETMNAILKDDPAELPETLPLGVRTIVARCVEKDPDNRFQSAKDLGFALAQSAPSGTQPGSAAVVKAAPAPRRQTRVWALMAAVGIAAAAAGAGHFLWRATAPPVWTGMLLGGPDTAWMPRISPDGHTLAFAALVAGQSQVAVMKPEAGNWKVLTHARDRGMVTAITWAADGNKIYYDRALDTPRGVYSVPVLGGEEQLVLEDAMYPEALPDGSLIAARLNAEHKLQLFRFWLESGKEQALPFQVNLTTVAPQVRVLPDGHHVVVIGTPISQSDEPGKEMYVLDLDSGNTRRLLDRGGLDQIHGPGVTRDGHSILFAEQVPFGIAALASDGRSVPRMLFPLTSSAWNTDAGPDGALYIDQLERPVSLLRFSASGGHAVELGHYPLHDDDAQFAVLGDGRAVWKEQVAGRDRLVIVAEGKEPVPLSGTDEETTFPVVRLGAREMAFAIGQERRTIGIASIATGRIERRIDFGGGALSHIIATPDGKTLYCTAAGAIWVQPAAGGSATRVRTGSAVAMDPDGKFMAVIDLPEGRTRLLRVPLDGGAEREIPIGGNARPAPGIESGAIGKDGKLLLGLQDLDSWFISPAVIDLATGRVTRIPIDALGDMWSMAWTEDGQVMASAVGVRAALWKFRPEGK